MTTEQFQLLYEKLLSGTITEEEEKQLSAYIGQLEIKNHPWKAEMGDKEEIEKEINQLLKQHIGPDKRAKVRFIGRLSAVAAAVTGTIILLTGIYRYSSHPAALYAYQPKAAVVAGHTNTHERNKATLTLADGTVITLDSAGTGSTTTKNGIQIIQVQKGQIAYKDGETGSTAAPSWSTISTPTGGQYQIMLEDGTKAWLNAASSLRFPTTFRNNERTVEVSGEVYFEIAKNEAKPFKVTFNGNTISVLGTHFNVMAYKDEAKSKVTLLEGAIKVSNNTGQNILKPGMQAQLSSSDSQIFTCKANLEEAVAWKNGFFTFDNENIESIMRKIARWYDVRVAYQGDMRNKAFSGTISRFENISEVLGMLELTGTIHFNLNGRDLQVTP